MLKSSFGLQYYIEIIKNNLSELQNFGLKRIGIFGSIVTGKPNQDSDLDILIEFEVSKNTYKNLLSIHDLLQNLFTQKIDLVTKDGLSKHIKDSVLNEVVYIEASS